VKQLGDVVVAHSKTTREEQAPYPNSDAAYCRPPHRVEMHMLEEILKGVHHAAHPCRDEAK
jgi:hypothetical protein